MFDKKSVSSNVAPFLIYISVLVESTRNLVLRMYSFTDNDTHTSDLSSANIFVTFLNLIW